jgi:hypothetical protein
MQGKHRLSVAGPQILRYTLLRWYHTELMAQEMILRYIINKKK